MLDQKVKVLIVVNMLTVRKLIVRTVKDLGYSDIVEVADGDSALKMIEKSDSNFSLVISDWNLPKCMGLELLKRVRSAPKSKKLPFILILPEANQKQMNEALDIGANFCIFKPITPDSLKEGVQSIYRKMAA